VFAQNEDEEGGDEPHNSGVERELELIEAESAATKPVTTATAAATASGAASASASTSASASASAAELTASNAAPASLTAESGNAAAAAEAEAEVVEDDEAALAAEDALSPELAAANADQPPPLTAEELEAEVAVERAINEKDAEGINDVRTTPFSSPFWLSSLVI
jgi:hypothetical protein